LDISSVLKTQTETARVLGLSTKTLGRYINKRHTPPASRGPGLIRAIAPFVDTTLLTRFADILDVPEHARPQAGRGVGDRAPAIDDAVDLALFGAAERHGIGPHQARAVVLDVLGRIGELGVPLALGRESVARVTARRTGT